ncbi:MAG TPA: hypothetical protein VFZ78_03965 [Flavisolibacter sp.]
MKKIFFATIALFILSNHGFSQLNWRALQNGQSHMIQVHAGLDYSTSLGIGYAFRLPVNFPVVAQADYSFPAGENVLDDFKTRLGAQAEVLHVGNFSAAVSAYGVFRRFENQTARIVNFGSSFSSVVGYFKRGWHAAAQVGFDKAITSQVKHSKWMHENYPGIQDGWYIPTGGNFTYGVQTGVSMGTHDVTVKAGRVLTQDFKTAPFIPYYVQVGYQKRF